jgi:hypothetical protein
VKPPLTFKVARGINNAKKPLVMILETFKFIFMAHATFILECLSQKKYLICAMEHHACMFSLH